MPEYQLVTDQIFTVDEFFSPAECAESIALAEETGFDEAPINTSFGPVVRKDIRNNSRVMIDDANFALQLWERIVDYIPHKLGVWTACGVNERFRFYRYEPGQRFDWHYDGAFERANGERSQLTFMVYLNDGFEGGATAFDGVRIQPAAGKALFFVHQQLHSGLAVSSGTKYVLRTDVMYSL